MPINDKAILDLLLRADPAFKTLKVLESEFLRATAAMEQAALRPDFDPLSIEAGRLRENVVQTGRAFVESGRLGAQELKSVQQAAKLVNVPLDQIEKELRDIDRGTKQVSSSFSSLSGIIKAASGAFALLKIGQFTRDGIELARTMDTAGRRIKALSDNQEEANEQLDFARELAERLKLSTTAVTDRYGRFLSTIESTNLEGEKGREVYLAVAEALRASGGSAQQFEQAMLAVEQILGKGKLQAEEVRKQLGNVIPGAFRIAAESIREEGESITEAQARLDKLLERGELIAEEFLPSFAAALRENFAGQLVEVLDGPVAKMDEISLRLEDLKRDFATAFLTELGEVSKTGSENLGLLETGVNNLGSAFGKFLSGFVVGAGAIAVAARHIGDSIPWLNNDSAFVDPLFEAEEALQKFLLTMRALGDDPSPQRIRQAIVQLQAAQTALVVSGDSLEDAQRRTKDQAAALAAELEKQGITLESLPAFMREVLESTLDVAKATMASAEATDQDTESKLAAEKAAAALARQERELAEAVEERLDKLIGNREELEKETEVLIEVGKRLQELAKEGRLNTDVAEEFSEEVVKLNKEWVRLGEDAPKALRDLQKGFPPVEKNIDELLKKSKGVVSEMEALRNQARSLREEAERRVTGGLTSEDLEEEQARLNDLVDDLGNKAALTADEVNKLSEAQDALFDINKQIRDVARDNEVANSALTEAYAEQNIEAELLTQSTLQARKEQEAKAKADREAAAVLGIYGRAQEEATAKLGDNTKSQFEFSKTAEGNLVLVKKQAEETEKAGDASKQQAEAVRESTSAAEDQVGVVEKSIEAIEEQTEAIEKQTEAEKEQAETKGSVLDQTQSQTAAVTELGKAMKAVTSELEFQVKLTEQISKNLGAINAEF